jgi:hypothetical protein
MRRKLVLLLAFSLIIAGSSSANAQNPTDVKRARERVRAIHEISLQEIARATHLPLAYIASFLPAGANQGKKLSEQADLSAKQYRTVRRLIAQRNYAVRETYSSLGLVIPPKTDVSFL